ncbi:MAG TPA: hypothetical protein VGS22_00105 [Thermoanaerobaculia bacterium]|jgi:hypothetical protein|nr:hypothetical protein [Thermoanaerobaculia bacterium]
MRRIAFLCFLFAAAIARPILANDDQTVRTFTKTFPGSGLKDVVLDIPVGEVQVTASDVDEVQVDLRVLCDRDHLKTCTERAKRLTFTAGRSENRVDVRASKSSGWGNHGLHVKAFVTAPRRLSVKADLGVGELHIDGFASDVTADLGVGEVHVTAPEAAVHSVSVDTGVGEGHLIAAGRHWSSEGLFTREIDWRDGVGNARISVDCGVGEAHVQLDRGVRTAAKR